MLANAGVNTFHKDGSLSITEDVFDLIVDTNLKGAWNTIQATAPHLIDAGGGSIIITSSAAGIRGQVPYAHYVASKHGVVGLMKAFANELAPHRIRVNTIHPTGVATAMATAPDAFASAEKYPLFLYGAANASRTWIRLPTNRIHRCRSCAPEEISKTVLFLYPTTPATSPACASGRRRQRQQALTKGTLMTTFDQSTETEFDHHSPEYADNSRRSTPNCGRSARWRTHPRTAGSGSSPATTM